MFEKLDDFFGRYMENVDSGKNVVFEFISNYLSGAIQLSLSVFGVLIMVISSPLWLIGKLSAQQGVQLTGGTLPDLQVDTTPEDLSGLKADSIPPTSN